jgi:triacylglycerol lipase
VRNLGGTEKVAGLVTLAGTNHGTSTAVFCPSIVSCTEMVPGSAFLTALNSPDETPGAVHYATWWSPCDEVINPDNSALLDGAVNTQTACIAHSQLYQDATVYSQVRSFVSTLTAAPIVASAR